MLSDKFSTCIQYVHRAERRTIYVQPYNNLSPLSASTHPLLASVDVFTQCQLYAVHLWVQGKQEVMPQYSMTLWSVFGLTLLSLSSRSILKTQQFRNVVIK